MILFHFALPFVLLLSRSLKRHGSTLRRVAILLLFMRVIDLIFFFAPAAHGEGSASGIHPIDFVTMLGMTAGLGGLWLFAFFRELAKRPLVPLGEPRLEEALEAAHAHH